MLNFIDEIKELNNTNVHIKDKDRVNKIINDIMNGGIKKLQVVSDFDRTITKQHENGKQHITSFGIFERCPSVSKEYVENVRKLTDTFFPIEIDPNIPLVEKRKLMEEWYNLSEKALVGLKVSQDDIENTASIWEPSVRDGTYELFDDLNKANVPVLVFSAGLGNSVVAVLKHFNVLMLNVKVVSNFLKYDENGVIQGFEDAAIHVLNKNELALKGTDYYHMVRDRENAILLGDSLGDAGMTDGVPHVNAVLKIGFLYDHIAENLPLFMDAFDIVLENDQTMNVVRAILQHMF